MCLVNVNLIVLINKPGICETHLQHRTANDKDAAHKVERAEENRKIIMKKT